MWPFICAHHILPHTLFLTLVHCPSLSLSLSLSQSPSRIPKFAFINTILHRKENARYTKVNKFACEYLGNLGVLLITEKFNRQKCYHTTYHLLFIIIHLSEIYFWMICIQLYVQKFDILWFMKILLKKARGFPALTQQIPDFTQETSGFFQTFFKIQMKNGKKFMKNVF